jgi:hypothetical protein
VLAPFHYLHRAPAKQEKRKNTVPVLLLFVGLTVFSKKAQRRGLISHIDSVSI